MRTAAPPGGGIKASALALDSRRAFGAAFAAFVTVLRLAAACFFLAMITLRLENEGRRRARRSTRSAPRLVRTRWAERALAAGRSACGRVRPHRPRFRACE